MDSIGKNLHSYTIFQTCQQAYKQENVIKGGFFAVFYNILYSAKFPETTKSIDAYDSICVY